ncbi:hypothetical protein I203_105258 [Kwoniella mangroviensis CBS 8507]|uniref:uncharacterized protein n=1 Tax=Kwoniella mangroviensis CBS 8507 TaxID=1296122 RepID=UPI00080CD627|nr:uncharacterized protein I203_01077 [Kwoniella mangroviensis CBS 8507]OCF69223.1 hypothetical protein I203_01077 [Kwoniella mangroviensis CBS 8507]
MSLSPSTEEKINPSDAQALAVTEAHHNEEYEEFLILEKQMEGAPHRKLMRKLDFRLLPTLSVLYLLASLDKANAGNAKLFGFLEEIGMTATQFNYALMYLFFTYGLFEPVCNVCLRRLGPKIWFPIAVTTWGLITTLTCVVSSYGGFVAIRLFLGAAEASIYPGGYLLLSMWYKPKELATRMALFYGANTAAGAFGGVIAYGVGNMDGMHGWRAWRWLFLIEGLITVFFGLASYFMLPPFPHTYKAGTKNSWLTPDEAKYARLRTKYANGPHAPTYVFQWKDVLAAAKDRKTYFMMMLFWWGGSIPTYSLSYTLPTMVKNLGYTAVKAQALTTPPYIFATIVTVTIGIISDRFRRRYFAIMSAYSLGLTGIIIIWITVHHPHLTGVSYFAIFLAAAGYSAQAPIVGAWTSENVPNPSKRAAAIGFLMLFGSIGGGSIGSNIYLANQAPYYPLGFGFSVGATVLGAMVPATIHWTLLKRDNMRKDRMDEAEVLATYTAEDLSAMEEYSPLFRYST